MLCLSRVGCGGRTVGHLGVSLYRRQAPREPGSLGPLPGNITARDDRAHTLAARIGPAEVAPPLPPAPAERPASDWLQTLPEAWPRHRFGPLSMLPYVLTIVVAAGAVRGRSAGSGGRPIERPDAGHGR